MPNLSQSEVVALPTEQLQSLVASTRPDGAYAGEVVWAKDELDRRGVSPKRIVVRISAADKRTMRAFAERCAGRSFIKIEAGSRTSTTRTVTPDINVRLVSEREDWSDTDLFDMHDWSGLRSITLTADGRGLIDFAIYERQMPQDVGDLLTHFQAVWENGRLARLEGSDGRGRRLDTDVA